MDTDHDPSPDAPPPASGAGEPPLDYGRYLELDRLLALQHPRSAPEHPDELLFIVVHQASELWFKVLRHEIEGLHAALARDDAMFAVLAIGRVNTLMEIVAGQLAALETLAPQRFAQFRGVLGRSSGSQSEQFRAVEALMGLRTGETATGDTSLPPLVAEAMARPTVESLFVAAVERAGFTLESLYLGPAPSPWVLIAEGLLEFDQRLARWRFLHVQLVERIIGPMTGGTGGSAGSAALQRRMGERCFPALWAVRKTLYRG